MLGELVFIVKTQNVQTKIAFLNAVPHPASGGLGGIHRAGCVAGALDENEYRGKLAAAGFESVGIEPTRIYKAEDAASFLQNEGIDLATLAPLVDGKFMSAFVRARKPLKA